MKLRKSKSEIKALVAFLQKKGYVLIREVSQNGDTYTLESAKAVVVIRTTKNSWVDIDTKPK